MFAEIKLMVAEYKSSKIDMELLFDDQEGEVSDATAGKIDWIFHNKILDQVQLKPMTPNFFDAQFTITNA